jgi:hypothetical protein
MDESSSVESVFVINFVSHERAMDRRCGRRYFVLYGEQKTRRKSEEDEKHFAIQFIKKIYD